MSIKVLNKTTSNLERRNTSDLKKVESRRKLSSFANKPTPLDFDSFIPWICLEWQVPDMVTIIRINQEKNRRRSSSAKSKSVSRSMRANDEDETKRSTSATNTIVTSSQAESAIPISAVYDSHGHLTEIAITICSSALHRKIIQAISLCLPFHSFLTKLLIRKGCLNYVLLYEIGKLLPHSNLTDVCLDDTYVPEGNYYLLLDQTSNMKYLSLNRCKINDDVCKEMASRIDFGRPAEKSLLMLDLSSNLITDVGAKYFGEILRRNRHLLHLNFLGNRITDNGLEALVKHLREFPLTCDEVIDKKRRKMTYYQTKSKVYERCLSEITAMQKSEEVCSLHSDKRSSLNMKHTKFKKNKKPLPLVIEEVPQTDLADKMTLEILGALIDPYNDDDIIIRDKHYYYTGNMKLCSLNVAYNNIEFPSLTKILEVLAYQCLQKKRSSNSGLLRIVLEGNCLPNFCPELERIDMYLKNAVASQTPVTVHHSSQTKRRTSNPMGKPKG